jgi:hypothetical protein
MRATDTNVERRTTSLYAMARSWLCSSPTLRTSTAAVTSSAPTEGAITNSNCIVSFKRGDRH